MKDHCTCFPETVWGIYIGDICKKHDIAYATWHDCIKHRFWADILLGWRVSTRAWRLILLGPVMTFVLFFVGGYAWRKNRTQNPKVYKG